MRPLWIIPVLSVCAFVTTVSAEVGTLYIKNNTGSRLDVWVDDSYQGWVPADRTCYVVSDGFVTPQSGRDGNPVEESHGGWHSKDAITVRGQTIADDPEKAADGGIKVDGDVDKKAYVWFGDDAPLTDEEAENADPIRKGAVEPIRAKEELVVQARPAEDGSVVGEWIIDGSTEYVLKDDGTAERKGKWPATGTWSLTDRRLTITVTGTDPVQTEKITLDLDEKLRAGEGKGSFSGEGAIEGEEYEYKAEKSPTDQ